MPTFSRVREELLTEIVPIRMTLSQRRGLHEQALAAGVADGELIRQALDFYFRSLS